MFDEFLYENPVFRLSDVLEWRERKGVSTAPRVVRNLIHYHIQAGHLVRIKRELYAAVPVGAAAESVLVDPYLIAGKAAPDGVLAYHTSLELHGVAYTSFQQFLFVTSQKSKAFEYQGQLFQPVYRKSMVDFSAGVEVLNRQGVELRITNLPRTFVDVLDKVALSGGWEEVFRSIENIAALDIDQVINYCLMFNNSVLAAKVGYFLELRQGAFAPSEKQVDLLLKHKPAKPQYLSKSITEPHRLIKKWNIMMPLSVVNKNWEEPNYDV